MREIEFIHPEKKPGSGQNENHQTNDRGRAALSGGVRFAQTGKIRRTS